MHDLTFRITGRQRRNLRWRMPSWNSPPTMSNTRRSPRQQREHDMAADAATPAADARLAGAALARATNAVAAEWLKLRTARSSYLALAAAAGLALFVAIGLANLNKAHAVPHAQAGIQNLAYTVSISFKALASYS
jgi:hypothetical protein